MKLIERIHLLSRADKLKPVRESIRKLAVTQGCSPENLDCLIMAINEACMNIMQHAYKGDENGEIILEFFRDDNVLVIRVHDFAEKVDLDTIKSRDLDDIRPGGLGVHFIHQVMDTVEYKDRDDEPGNMLEMRKKIGDIKTCSIKCKEDL
ncbi:MAG: ATP-binding protein [Gammaproteobacteria bacterium]|nr:ATP-binding protein [Gammaproteobacteria bacterium]MCW8911009.1 ATP-binding protein [Gammaproteobacteria bacterium]MCW9006196.1 ATP-binding protein [Gammaproteobacteria bacterium]MCW9056447.1 ATP-binding protein [Gammaproteobacteria bacterium]